MKLLTRIIISLAVFALPTSSLANEVDDHEVLWDAVQNAGISIYVNEPSHCKGSTSGVYLWNKETHQAAMVICQDNGVQAGVQVEWTDNDLDTLRHEAHHIVQDCLEGGTGDGQFGLFFEYPDKYNEFISRSLSPTEIHNISRNYHLNGATDYVVLRELEAFAVAKNVGPKLIAEALVKACPTK